MVKVMLDRAKVVRHFSIFHSLKFSYWKAHPMG